MNPQSPILDQPQVIDWAEDAPDFTQRLANGDILFEVDANTDLCDLYWPWAGEHYAKRIALRVSAPREDDLMPMVTRLYPGHQELILGTEGVILTKRVAAPRQSEYDRSVIWLLDCQAEGDRLLRLDVTIDWGEPLTQRMVDGLLVAQRNPGPQRGIYSQSNAELTCVFGNPQARPDQVDLISPQEAHLVYHVLVNGMVEVPLMLTVSDVGEQMAWNGFLALRDADRAFALSTKTWETLLKTGRLWTPDPALNQAVQLGKLTAARQLQRVRTGFAATDGDTVHTAALVNCTDSHDITMSRNLLAHLRRVAEATLGRLPRILPSHPKSAPLDPGAALVRTNGAYLTALVHHLHHHFDWALLDEHYQAVGLCAAQLQRVSQDRALTDGPELQQALCAAVQLAQWQGAESNAAQWQPHAADCTQPPTLPPPVSIQRHVAKPWDFADPWAGITWAGTTLWQGCGLGWQEDALWVMPTWPAAWQWWALLDLPYVDDRKLSLLWDGQTLHSTQAVRSTLPVQQWATIRARRTDELEFDLHFALQSEQDGLVTHNTVHPTFLRSDSPDG